MTSNSPHTSRQRKLQRRRERREIQKKASTRQASRNRWVRLGITMLLTTAVYAVVMLVWDPFGLVRGVPPG
jgi:cell division septal protein FtsQ